MSFLALIGDAGTYIPSIQILINIGDLLADPALVMECNSAQVAESSPNCDLFAFPPQ